MASGKDYSNLYGQAYVAYGQGNYEEAASYIEEMGEAYPDDPNVLLLQGHIYLGLERYDIAQQKYEKVLQISERQDLRDCAVQSLEQVQSITGVVIKTESRTVESSKNIVRTGEEEKTLLPGMGESTFVVSSDVAAQQFQFGEVFPAFSDTRGENNPNIPTYQPWLGETDPAHLDSLLDRDAIPTVQISPSQQRERGEDLMPNLDEFNDASLDNLADFDLTDIAPELPDSSLFMQTGDLGMGISARLKEAFAAEGSPTVAASSPPPGMVTWLKPDDSLAGEMTGASSRYVKPTVEVDPGFLGWFVNAPLKRKQLYIAIAAGVTSALTVLVVNGVSGMLSPHPATPAPVSSEKSSSGKNTPKSPNAIKTDAKTGGNKSKASTGSSSQAPLLLVALLTGVAAAGVTWLISNLLIRQIKRTIDDLQNQFDAIYEGNFNVRARIYSEDELGQLAQSFNYISQVILTATSEAQERASATEKAREKLQRQVIRLLDDVEGASRGDLTVQAEVTADELGAVADAFNLTIQNLREIVSQVKQAAKQVNRNSTDSESFARNNSSDALRMAEELAVTLNSVQLMTESIQRVAENAREAEEVAHTSSLTALKGGESVERTVAGILQIRETVSETARKVKRLAEASQEISKIVAVISQIASRTNLLALNASIQAARAGDAGRGFAIVADEVRQLADRSAKSLKEIEQIVLQIQSETGSVMTAMEEGIQQVIDVTDKSEQSKRALEDIIEVSNRINTLVRSITADTVRQQENSSAVAQVMQSIELTAQETSQESQRVAGSLQSLVSISRDLLTSVERFRLDQGTK
ncbi:MAG: methyl-accepting chemotaxis protein [Woronichinia naegeliana WA131]|uniref:Methyl-accepting chemotaxis protein n=1 Tax=Woronichinia naegeliana WA131 TaxID=2824559 RepID=A0A977KWS6_9CYAN|nr:MAG: methyl-accepting chemotaxis protein [Woronichinia naegeliana WA131]